MQVQFPCRKHFDAVGLPQIIAKKVEGLIEALNEPVVSTSRIKKYLAEGIPDEASILREYCWKIILGYLPENKAEWDTKVKKSESIYQEFVKMFLPEEKFPEYPLVMNKKQPRWEELLEDFSLWQQIEKDTSRTHAELSFFTVPAPEIMIPYFTSPRKQKFKTIYGEEEQAYKDFLVSKEMQRKCYRYDYMSRILYIYSKLNPKIQYVQGMNEILAPIFYIVNASRAGGALVEEASCFFMYNNAITDIIELHIKDLDKSENGIYGKLNSINEMLVVIEPRVWNRLEKLKINPFYYCFRWVTLLFAQDFPLFDTLRIWESLFSSDNRMEFMSYFAISIILSVKDYIMEHEFVEVMNHLQNIGEITNVNQIIAIANALFSQYREVDFKQYSRTTREAIIKKEEKESKKEESKKNITKITNFFKNLL